jgi:hypothetical protein
MAVIMPVVGKHAGQSSWNVRKLRFAALNPHPHTHRAMLWIVEHELKMQQLWFATAVDKADSRDFIAASPTGFLLASR